MTENLSTFPPLQAGTAAPTAASSSFSVRGYLDGYRAELRALLATRGSAGVLLSRRHAAIMDGLLKILYAKARFDRYESTLLLGAVGGYGRQLLGWKSDLDICFVTNGSTDELLPMIQNMLYPLWDAGISVGHQVVNISDAVADALTDVPTATELLDFRPLAGDPSLARVLNECVSAGVFGDENLTSFIERLEQLADGRHHRFGDSVYLLEPDVKNGTGGLRDLDFALWAARARFGSNDLPELALRGMLSQRQLVETSAAVDFLWAVRNHLHCLAGRRVDRLTFSDQEAVARLLGYGENTNVDAQAEELQATGAMVETFMSDYYRHARVVARSRDQILGYAKRRRGPEPVQEDLGEGLVRCDGGLGIGSFDLLESDPALALRVYAAAVVNEQPVLSRSRDAISRSCSNPSFCAALRESPEASALFVKLASTCRSAPFRTDSILGELHDVGLLLAMIPEFAPVVGRVHHDLYHVYTVDVHSVAAVDRLRALTRGDLVHVHPLACRLAAEVTRPRLLFLATLLHDVGKAIGGHDHANRGAVMAKSILERLGLEPEEVDDACHLIRQHLAMYLVAARRDLGDPATIAEFITLVRGREGLRDLYLLTVSDLSTTSPTSMTKWKAGLLDALLHASEAALAGTAGLTASRVSRVRAQVRELWTTKPDEAELDDFLATMPERYLLSNSPEDIMAHAKIATEPRQVPVAAAWVRSRDQEVVELCVVTDNRPSTGLCVVASDRPGLLASIAAAISANQLEIHAAQVHSRPLPDGGSQAVDLFWVHGPRGSKAAIEERLPKLEQTLRDVITGAVQASDLLKRPKAASWTKRALPAVFTEVVIDHKASARHTVVEVLSQDRPALLFLLAKTLHDLGLSISVAKINTEGTRAIDVFYVTEADGKKLSKGPRSEEVRCALLECLKAD